MGAEGGGHVGRDEISTLVLIPQVVDAVQIPVVAAGGIGDGRGLAGEPTPHLGLLGMRERAKRLGGTFDIQGVPGDGTIVTVSIPLKPIE